jgi:hypothetical protein
MTTLISQLNGNNQFKQVMDIKEGGFEFIKLYDTATRVQKLFAEFIDTRIYNSRMEREDDTNPFKEYEKATSSYSLFMNFAKDMWSEFMEEEDVDVNGNIAGMMWGDLIDAHDKDGLRLIYLQVVLKVFEEREIMEDEKEE